MKRILLIIFLTFAAFGAYYLIELGAFKNIKFQVETVGPLKMIYKDHTGPYHKIGPVIQEVQQFLLTKNQRCEGFGEFLDDPSKVEHIRLRSHAGCLVEDLSTAGELPQEFQTKTLDSRLYLTSEFEGSPALGPYKVYDQVDAAFRKENLQMDGAVIEIYQDLPSGLVKTKYLFPVKK